MTQEMQLPFDDKFQLTLLELVLTDKNVAEKCYVHLRPEFFPNEYFAKLFSILKTVDEQVGAAPSANQLKNEIAKITDPKQSQLYIDIFNRITKPQDFRDYEYVKKNLDNYFKSRNIFKLTNDIIKNQHLHPDKLTELIENHIKTISEISFDNVKTRGLKNLLGFLDECKADAGDVIPTFLPSIDAALGGGCPKGTMAMAIGGTNVGKSIWLVNWTYKLIKSGYKVIYVNLEGYEKQAMQRLICRAIRAPIYNVKNKILTEHQLDQVVKFEHECAANFKFFHNNSFDMTIESFMPMLRAMITPDFKPDVVVYDYGQLLKSKRKHDGLRHEQSYCHRAITSLAGELDHLAITVAQGQRDTNIKNNAGSSLTRMTDISECFEINRAAATVFTLNRSERDEEMEWIKILMDKQRDGKKNIVEICKTDFNTVAMYGDESEGLGFTNSKSYLESTAQKHL
jgi:replicative DNA helicase